MIQSTKKRLARKVLGQATTEYMLVLFAVVSLFVLVSRKFLRPYFEQFGGRIQRALDERLFPKSENLHQFRMGRPRR